MDTNATLTAEAEGRKTRRLSPVNQRRLANFKANRRGYWSFWIFLVLFVVTLFAELITNDRPLIVSYKGEILAPVLIDYPEEKFGGFLAVTDYRDPFIQDEINANGWMIWPLIRYSYRTVNNEIPVPAPAPPSWMMDKEQRCSRYPLGVDDPNCVIGNWNWLGTDDQGRDVVARLVYGFRLSVLFGLAMTIASSVIGIAAGAVQGYYGGWADLLFQRFIEIWTAMPTLYLILIVSSVLTPDSGCFSAFCWPSPGWLLWGSSGPSSCAAETLNISRQPRHSGSPIRSSCGGTCCPTPWWRRSPSCPSS